MNDYGDATSASVRVVRRFRTRTDIDDGQLVSAPFSVDGWALPDGEIESTGGGAVRRVFSNINTLICLPTGIGIPRKSEYNYPPPLPASLATTASRQSTHISALSSLLPLLRPPFALSSRRINPCHLSLSLSLSRPMGDRAQQRTERRDDFHAKKPQREIQEEQRIGDW